MKVTTERLFLADASLGRINTTYNQLIYRLSVLPYLTDIITIFLYREMKKSTTLLKMEQR
jgi:hypothetical protein